MNKKTLALWGLIATASFSGKAENVDTTKLPTTPENGKVINYEEIVTEKAFILNEKYIKKSVEEQLEGGNGGKGGPEGDRILILEEGEIKDNSNSLMKNRKMFLSAQNQIAYLNGQIMILEDRMNSLENSKLELAREILEKKGKIDAGDATAWETYQKENSKKVRKLLSEIEKNSAKIRKKIENNDVSDYQETQKELNEALHLKSILEAINELFLEKQTVSSLQVKDGKEDSEFMKKYKKVVMEIFNSQVEGLENKVENWGIYLDSKKGKEKIVAVNDVLKIIQKLEKSKDSISYEDNAKVKSAINLLQKARGLEVGGVNDLQADKGVFKDELEKLVDFDGLVGLDESRRKLLDYLGILSENNYPEELSMDNLNDFLEFPKDSKTKIGIFFENSNGVYLKPLIEKLNKAYKVNEKYVDKKTKTSISEKKAKETISNISRYNQLEKMKKFKDRWEKLSHSEKVSQYEFFSDALSAIVLNYYKTSEKQASDDNKILSDKEKGGSKLKKDLERFGKTFWKDIYDVQLDLRIEGANSGKVDFAGFINIYKDGRIDLEGETN